MIDPWILTGAPAEAGRIEYIGHYMTEANARLHMASYLKRYPSGSVMLSKLVDYDFAGKPTSPEETPF